MRVAQAIDLAEADTPDVALLDVNVHGETAFAAAEALNRQGVPVGFASGYGGAGLPAEWSQAPVLQKPFTRDQLAAVLERLAAQGKGFNG